MAACVAIDENEKESFKVVFLNSPGNIDKNNQEHFFRSPYYYGVDNHGLFTVRETEHYINYNANLQQINSQDILEEDQIIPSSMAITDDLFSNISPYSLNRGTFLDKNSRASYNVGLIVGTNFGSLKNINISANLKIDETFVGFVGGLARKTNSWTS